MFQYISRSSGRGVHVARGGAAGGERVARHVGVDGAAPRPVPLRADLPARDHTARQLRRAQVRTF